MRGWVLIAMLGLAAGAVRRKTSDKRWCPGKVPRGQFNFCNAYDTVYAIMNQEKLARAFIDFYWDEIAGPGKQYVTRARAEALNNQIKSYESRSGGKINLNRVNWRRIFSRIDTNSPKGAISKDEVFKTMSSSSPYPYLVLAGFKFLDKNNSYFLSLDEIQKPLCAVSDSSGAGICRGGRITNKRRGSSSRRTGSTRRGTSNRRARITTSNRRG